MCTVCVRVSVCGGDVFWFLVCVCDCLDCCLDSWGDETHESCWWRRFLGFNFMAVFVCSAVLNLYDVSTILSPRLLRWWQWWVECCWEVWSPKVENSGSWGSLGSWWEAIGHFGNVPEIYLAYFGLCVFEKRSEEIWAAGGSQWFTVRTRHMQKTSVEKKRESVRVCPHSLTAVQCCATTFA